ncbi:MAG: ATP-dependent RNA helicase HrpA [Desulfobacteraceae bacterium]|jgi:ATP-dependent helicase HrpA
MVASIKEQLVSIGKKIPLALTDDGAWARREIRNIHRMSAKGAAPAKLNARCRGLVKRVDDSIKICRQRQRQQPLLNFDSKLPITAKKDQILEALGRHQVLIVAGETGSGKTTQLPKLCLAAGRGVYGMIGLTQPRRIAAMTISRRIAEEMGETVGQTVGYKIRFNEKLSQTTRIKVMTDGILLAEAHHHRSLYPYDTLIIDEAHERSLNIDFSLGIIQNLLRRRPDLKLIITSATIDTEKFSRAFNDAPVIEVSGRMYPVQTRYLASSEGDASHIEQAVAAVEQLASEKKHGDILIFMPTEQDIRDTCGLLEGRRMVQTLVIPLFARLSERDQQRVFRSTRRRKIIVATNVAETSLTIPGIQYVIDSGLARISQYTPRSRSTTLPVVPISQSSADQRQGRCGRMANGICIRLYDQADYDQRPRFTLPEIQRANLADVILRMIALDIGNIEDFPFIDPPAPKSVQDGYALLLELGAIVPGRKASRRYVLTAKGELMAKLPLDPRLSCMLYEAHRRNCLNEVAIIAAALSIQDPRERPAEKQVEADQRQAVFVDKLSDFITLINIWVVYHHIVKKRDSWSQVKKFCRDHYLSFNRMREWRDIYQQILSVLAEHRMRPHQPDELVLPDSSLDNNWYHNVHKSLLSGFLSNIALKKEKQVYDACHNRRVMLFPGSGLFNSPPAWVVAAEMVKTSRLFARCAAAIDPSWIEAVAKPQCRYSYHDPHWDKRRGKVMAIEQVSLYGLVIDRRPKPFGPIDPGKSSSLFIDQALIEGNVHKPEGFMVHNQALVDQITDMENRLRRRDILVEKQKRHQYYQNRIDGVYDWQSLKKRIRQSGGDGFLRMRKTDLMNYQPDDVELSQFPHQIEINRQTFTCCYEFNPGQEDDGVTISIPASATRGLTRQNMEWPIPGLLAEKISALIKALPKNLRKQLVPVASTAENIARDMPIEHGTHLATALSRFIQKNYAVEIPAAAWNDSALPDYLRMRICITDKQGTAVRHSRDPAILDTIGSEDGLPKDLKAAQKDWEKPDIVQWDFGDLPETIQLTGAGGTQWTAFPALEKRNESIALVAFASREQARRSHPQGVKALLLKKLGSEVKYLRKNLKLPEKCETMCHYFGGSARIVEHMVERVLNDSMAKQVRSAAGFHALQEQLMRKGVAGRGQQTRQTVVDLLSAYAKLRVQLHKLEQANLKNRPVLAFLLELREALANLVPKNFIQLYDNPRLKRLIRYIQAMGLRAARGADDLEKDRIKTASVAPFEQHMRKLLASLGPQTSSQRRQAIEAFYWMLEEYKISVFAQEIKTDFPVSAKRLKDQLKEIESMV